MCGRFFISNRGKTEPSMPSTTLATNSPHTVPACSLSMWNQTNTTSSEDRNTASSKSSSRKGRRYRKASIAIFHLSNIRRCAPITLCLTFKKTVGIMENPTLPTNWLAATSGRLVISFYRKKLSESCTIRQLSLSLHP